MSRFRTMLFTVIAAGFMLTLSVATTNAQRPNPTAQFTAQARSQGPCRDPWITIAIWDMFASTRQPAGIGDFGECNKDLYNGGSWSSYDELYRGVKTAFDGMNGNARYTLTPLGGGQVKITTDGGSAFTASITIKLISHDSGTLVGNDGSSLVAAGGGNFHVQSTSTEKKINLGKSVLIIKRR